MTLFDTSKLTLQSIQNRNSLMTMDNILPLDYQSNYQSESLTQLAGEISQANNVILAIGGHVIRSGVQRFLIDLFREGLIDHIAMNGACAIHDYELARFGQTTENVQINLEDRQFGLWEELKDLNNLVMEFHPLGEIIGKGLQREREPYRDISLLSNLHCTVHVGIGYDIVCELPNYEGCEWGGASHLDFLKFVHSVSKGGVFLNIGSAIMGPEIFLKALAMARNAGYDAKFVTGVFDIADIPDPSKPPKKDDPLYYFRPYKTVLHRTAKKSHYIQGYHRDTIPALWRLLTQ